MKPETLEIMTEKEEETKAVGKILAEEIIKYQTKSRKAVIIGLEGELGSGKTTFIQGMAHGFGIKEKITSPTFVILKEYELKVSSFKFQVSRFYHIDCYRLAGLKDLMDLDFKEIVNNSQNIIAIEWAERVRKILPENTLWIRLEYFGQNKRKVTIKWKN